MKKKLFLLLTLAVCVAFSISSYAQQEVMVYVNGNKVVSDVPAVINNGSVMIPFRSILNALDVKDNEIHWHENSKSIEITSGERYIFLAIGSTGSIVDNQMILLNTAPYITSGRTFIPVRFISAALGASVDWDGDTSTVTITKKK